MKTKIAILFAAFLVVIGASAQTNLTQVPNLLTNQPAPSLGGGISEVLESIGLSPNPTNYAAVVFIGHSLTGDKLSAGAVLIENVNRYLGVVGGLDRLWFGGKTGSANIVSGGISLKTTTYPLREVFNWIGEPLGTNTWAYQFEATPYAIELVGTPLNGTGSANGGLASISRAGIDFSVYNFKGWQLGVGGDYGNRTGAGNYDGNWMDFTFNIRKGF